LVSIEGIEGLAIKRPQRFADPPSGARRMQARPTQRGWVSRREALEEWIAAAQVGVVARFDIKGGFGRSQKSKAGMGNGEGEGSTGRDALRPDSSGPRSRDHAENVLD
jgi:hypothetical protein